MHNFRDLLVWQKSHALTLDVYRATEAFPRHELYGLTSQARRAASSIGLNLAEGGGKRTDPDRANYVQRAIGSSCEIEYALLLARDLGLLPPQQYAAFETRITEIRKMLMGLWDHLAAHRA